MPDSDPDLYSFLRSKDIGDSEEENDASEADDSDAQGADEEPDVEVVDSFDHSDSSGTDRDLNFEDDDLPDKLPELPHETLDTAPFGIVQVDDEGIVQFYNQYESNMAGVDPNDAIGKNFFTELAPCSGNRLFHGRFKKGVRKNNLDEQFNNKLT
jgi:photoactive yellow protein